MKIKCTTDRYVFQHIDLSTSLRFATIDITATFISKVEYTVKKPFFMKRRLPQN